MHRFSLILSIAALAFAAPLGAQQLGPSKVPDGHKPPPGMCRIWIDGVPPGRQAAPTDCATAVRNRPVNGRVIWGDDDRKRDGDRPTRPAAEDRDRSRTTEEPRRPRSPEESETRGQDRPRETRETPRREPRGSAEPARPRETRDSSSRQPAERPRATPPRKPDDDSKARRPERSNERRKPDLTRKPR